jgi:alpha-glucosidase
LSLMISHFGNFVPSAAVHNIYVLNLLKATFEGLAALRPGIRNFIIARGGYAGMQRYAALWTGDSASSWDFLRVNLPEALNLGLSGIPISGCDIGGFGNGSSSGDFSAPPPSHQIVGGVTNYELLTRWMHLGSFLPWYRNHYNGYTKQFQEPWAYGEPVPTNCRKYVELRYRMLHVYYSAMYECTQTGMPIARALFLNDPFDIAVYDHLDDQFCVGHDVLVAPVLDPHETADPPTPPLRSIYLPAGSQWYAFKDNMAPLDAPVDGGTLIQGWYAPLDLVPIYVRAGSILPMRELEQYVGQLAQNPITFNIYPGADSTFNLYLDDGTTTAAEKNGIFRLTQISHTGIPGGQRIRIFRRVDKYSPQETFYFVSLLGTNPPVSVSAGATSLPNVFTPDSLGSSGANAYYYNASIKTTFVKIFDTQPDITVEVTF